MDFTQITEEPDVHPMVNITKSNVRFFECGDEQNIRTTAQCKKGVQIWCHMNNYTDPLRAGTLPQGVSITTTNLNSRGYLNSKITNGVMDYGEGEKFLENFEILGFSSYGRSLVDNIPGTKLHLNYTGGIERFYPGKNHNYIIMTESGEQPCVQEIIDSIKFLNK